MPRLALSMLMLALLACGEVVLPVSRHCDDNGPADVYTTVPFWNADPETLAWSLVESAGRAWNRKCLRFERVPTEAEAILKIYPVQNVCPLAPTGGGRVLAKTHLPTATVAVYMKCFMELPPGYEASETLVGSLTHEFGHASGLPGHVHEEADPKLAANSFERMLMDHGIAGIAIMNPMIRPELMLTILDEQAYDLRILSYSPFPSTAAVAPAGTGDILDVAEAPDRCLLVLQHAR